MGRGQSVGQSMEVIKTYKPGEHGTLKYQKRFGERLVVVRYRRDRAKSKIYTTVELIVDERDDAIEHLDPEIDQARVQCPSESSTPNPPLMVAVKIKYYEVELRTQIKSAGAWWDQEVKVWRLPHGKALALGLGDRIISEKISEL